MSGFLVVPFLLIGMVLMIFEKWNLKRWQGMTGSQWEKKLYEEHCIGNKDD
jgi:hypothetical protein